MSHLVGAVGMPYSLRMVRDKITEIIGIRERGQGFGYSRGIQEIRALVDGWNGAIFRAPPQFIVIRLVTILEVFTRDWAAQIIDAGEPYVSRGANLVKGALKIDFALAQALVGKQLSFGELVSHELSVNTIGDIDRVFSSLIDESLFHHLRGVLDRWAIRVEGAIAAPLMPDSDWVRATLVRLFEQRHIFVHELPEDEDVGAPGLDAYIRAVSQFVNTADEAFNTLLHGDYPLTQLEMNEAAANDARKAEEALASLLKAIDPSGEDSDLRASQSAWELFRDRQAEFRSKINRPLPGSIAPTLYSLEVEKLTRARIEQLEWYLNRKEGDLLQ